MRLAQTCVKTRQSTWVAIMLATATMLSACCEACADDDPLTDQRQSVDVNCSSDTEEQFPASESVDSAAASPVVAARTQYWGNSFSLKFHRPSCPFAQAMNPIHVQFFQSGQQAIALGERPCRYCLPPYWTSVRCVLLAKPAIDNNLPNTHESGNVSQTSTTQSRASEPHSVGGPSPEISGTRAAPADALAGETN
jgi:hypothetical protein